MIRDYSVTSPSLDGVLRHESIGYEGIRRPVEIDRIFDRPSSVDSREMKSIEKQKLITEYFHDIYGIFMKRFCQFAIEMDPSVDETVKLQALLQELIKVKKLLGSREIKIEE